MSTNHGYLAAIDTTGLYVAEATGIKRYGGMHEEPSYSLQFLLAVAEAYHISQLWVHGSMEKHLFDFQAPQWDIRPEPGPQLRRWYHAFRPGEHGDGIDLAFPAHDENCSWQDCESAAVLLADLVTFNAALGMHFRSSPGSTGVALMRDIHPRAGLIRTQMDTIHAPPPPAVLPTYYGAPAQDMSWMRPLDDAEKNLAYGHIYDKNGAYLAACASLELGLGAWELWSVDDIDHLSGFQPGHLLPGYYHVMEAHCRADWSLPSPLDAGGLFASRGQSDYWVMAPSLDVALRAGYFVDVSEAFVYPKHARVLAQWEARLRDAGMLIGGNEICQRVRKEIYTQSIQWLGLPASTEHTGKRPSLYHPDWRHAIVSMTSANIWRNAQSAVKLGAHIPAIFMKDTMLVLTNNPLPAEHAEQIGLKIGKGPGQWKIRQASIPMEELRPAFDALAVRGSTAMGLSALRGISESRRRREAAIA